MYTGTIISSDDHVMEPGDLWLERIGARYGDRTEAEMFIWDFLNPHFMEAGAILAAGSVDKIDKGYDSIRLLYSKIREEYLRRCERIGFNRRERCMVPEEPPF